MSVKISNSNMLKGVILFIYPPKYWKEHPQKEKVDRGGKSNLKVMGQEFTIWSN